MIYRSVHIFFKFLYILISGIYAIHLHLLIPDFNTSKKIAVSTKNIIHVALNRWSMLRVRTASRIIGKPKKFDTCVAMQRIRFDGSATSSCCQQMQTLTRPLRFLEKKT